MILSVSAQEVSAYIIFKRPNGHKGADGTTYINKGDISTLISLIDAVQTKKINKETSEFKFTVDKIDLTYIYRIFHPTASEHFLLGSHGTVCKISHILHHE